MKTRPTFVLLSLGVAWVAGGCGGAVSPDRGQAGDIADSFEAAPNDLPGIPDVPETVDVDSGPRGDCPVCMFTISAGRVGAMVEIPDGAQVEQMYGANDLSLTDRSYGLMVSRTGITRRLWSVTLPDGSVATIHPDNVSAQAQFQPTVTGAYLIALEIEGGTGCIQTCLKTVNVVPLKGCVVELTWNTPSDSDQTDTCPSGPMGSDCGSDMDLHVLHPLAAGPGGQPLGYFAVQYDCYWMNSNPTPWDVGHPEDSGYQPHLLRDDVDGAGPEIFHYALPPSDTCYRVGVHYFDDHGWGRSYPTLRLYLDGGAMPVYETTLAQAMIIGDLWDAGSLCCGNASQPFTPFTAAGSQEPVIFPKYPSPFP
jgi:hypothetical protein